MEGGYTHHEICNDTTTMKRQVRNLPVRFIFRFFFPRRFEAVLLALRVLAFALRGLIFFCTIRPFRGTKYQVLVYIINNRIRRFLGGGGNVLLCRLNLIFYVYCVRIGCSLPFSLSFFFPALCPTRFEKGVF